MPLVTICLPVFNSGKFLNETIISVMSQTYHKIQVIAIDDCSTDDSYEILKGYKSDNFIVLRNSKNLGLKENWNKCLEMAAGKYIKMMGADDILFPECISKQVEILESINVDLVSSNRYVIDASSHVLLRLKYPLQGYIYPKKALRKLVGAGRNIIGEPVVCLIRKDALISVGGFSALNNYVIDIETWAKLIRIKGLFAMDDYLSSFRVSNTSTSSKEGFNQIRSVFEFIESFSAQEVGLFTKVKACFLAVIFGFIRNLIFFFTNRVR